MDSRVNRSDPGSFRADYIAEVAAAAEHFAAQPIPPLSFSLYRRFDEEGNRLAYEDAYFQRRRQLVACALTALSGGGRIAALEDILWAICDEFTWALPAHLGGRSLESEALGGHETCLDLFSCETAFALAEIGDLLCVELAPAVVSRSRKEVLRRVLVPFVTRGEKWNWELMRNNWCAVCAGSIGAAALYLHPDGNQREAVLDRVYPTLDRFLDSFSEDGACLEGLGYWTYGVGFYTAFADLLLQRTGGRIDLLANEKFRRIAAFQSAAYLNENLAVSFSDSDAHERYRPGLSAYLARRFSETRLPPVELAAKFSDDHCGRWCLSYRDLLWTETAPGSQTIVPVEVLPRWFPDAQWLVCPAREREGIAFAAKGGHNDEPHNHNDVGSFILARGDDQLIADLGAGEYVKDYFNENRYSIFCNSSLSHSVPIIKGFGQSPGAERRAREVEFRLDGRKTILSMDVSAAYDVPSLRRVSRRFEFTETGVLILVDEFEFDVPRFEIVERFVTYGRVLPSEKGTIIQGERTALLVTAEGMRPLVREHSHRDHFAHEVAIRSLDFRYFHAEDASTEGKPSTNYSVVFRFEFSPITYVR